MRCLPRLAVVVGFPLFLWACGARTVADEYVQRRGLVDSGVAAGDAPVTVDVPVSTDDVPVVTEDLPSPIEDLPTPIEDLPQPPEDLPQPPEDLPIPTEDAERCRGGRTFCGGTCVFTTVNREHCGGCFQTCDRLEECENSRCVSTCERQGMIACGGVCVPSLDTPEHCGECFRSCGPGGQCVRGRCLMQPCSAGQSLCGPTCVDLRTDASNCGMCGNACSEAFTCADGQCVRRDVPIFGGQSFRIEVLSDQLCTLIDHGTWSGDDRGGIVFGNDSLYYTGDVATVRLGGLPLVHQGTLTRRDALVSNLRTGTVYSLAVGGVPVENVMGSLDFAVDSLAELSPTLQPTGRAIRLSMPFRIRGGFSGMASAALYSGWDRIVLHDDLALHHIALPSGAVTRINFTTVLQRTPCENWATWGVAEYFDDTLHLAYVGGINSVVRYNTRTGAITTIQQFRALSDMCGFTVSPQQSRWYFHHENGSEFTENRAGDEWAGTCPARLTVPR